jgi:hypothetical protein
MAFFYPDFIFFKIHFIFSSLLVTKSISLVLFIMVLDSIVLFNRYISLPNLTKTGLSNFIRVRAGTIQKSKSKKQIKPVWRLCFFFAISVEIFMFITRLYQKAHSTKVMGVSWENSQVLLHFNHQFIIIFSTCLSFFLNT